MTPRYSCVGHAAQAASQTMESCSKALKRQAGSMIVVVVTQNVALLCELLAESGCVYDSIHISSPTTVCCPSDCALPAPSGKPTHGPPIRPLILNICHMYNSPWHWWGHPWRRRPHVALFEGPVSGGPSSSPLLMPFVAPSALMIVMPPAVTPSTVSVISVPVVRMPGWRRRIAFPL